jgi:hypothetical protein
MVVRFSRLLIITSFDRHGGCLLPGSLQGQASLSDLSVLLVSLTKLQNSLEKKDLDIFAMVSDLHLPIRTPSISFNETGKYPENNELPCSTVHLILQHA